MRFFLCLLFLCTSLFAVDFDVIVVGTSPFSLFEALYQSHSGKKVLILEEAAECGGAWKSIPVCGVPHADLGCHQIGRNQDLKAFLEEYAGCKIVSQERPLLPLAKTDAQDYYFSRGCYELIEHLLNLIQVTDIVILTNTKLENVFIDPSHKMAIAHTKEQNYSTHKFIVTPMSCFSIGPTCPEQTFHKSKYCHLYLLIQDPTPPRFSYYEGIGAGASRVMNLTHFAGLSDTGQHLIVFQVHSADAFTKGQELLDALRAKNLVASEAYLLKSDPYIYEVGTFSQKHINQAHVENFFDVLQTSHFEKLMQYIPKWKQVLKPYREMIIGSYQ
jgi:hypothetical protein